MDYPKFIYQTRWKKPFVYKGLKYGILELLESLIKKHEDLNRAISSQVGIRLCFLFQIESAM